jgi:MOSC domain-containing protein YiiM
MKTIEGRVASLYWAPGASFITTPLSAMTLGYEGIPGDKHAGLTRRSGVREPWHTRGTEMRNERQLSILSAEELAEIAATLGLPHLRPEWIGANLVLSGIPQLTHLPPRTVLQFEDGAAIRIDGDNAPCRSAGRGIVQHVPDRPDLEFAFVKAAMGKRGLVGWVEVPGTIAVGEGVKALIWPVQPYSPLAG